MKLTGQAAIEAARDGATLCATFRGKTYIAITERNAQRCRVLGGEVFSEVTGENTDAYRTSKLRDQIIIERHQRDYARR